MPGVLDTILTRATAIVEGLTPASGFGARSTSYRRIAHGELPRGRENDRTFWFHIPEVSIDESSTSGVGDYLRVRMTVPMKLRMGAIGPSETQALSRLARDALQVTRALNADSDWPANTVRVHVDGNPTFERDDKTLVARIPLNIEFEEV